VILIIALFGVYLYSKVKAKAEQERQDQRRSEIARMKREDFEERQRAKGLESFVDRKGEEKWGSHAEIVGWRTADEEAKVRESLFNQVATAIKAFKPIKRYEFEQGYHDTLYSFLTAKFPNAKHERQEGASRPDIVIGNIAIEVKGPTDTRALDTLATKYLKYRGHYERVIFVLFDPQYSQTHFNEIHNGIKRDWPEAEVIVKSFL
jgi:hypothetical protein